MMLEWKHLHLITLFNPRSWCRRVKIILNEEGKEFYCHLKDESDPKQAKKNKFISFNILFAILIQLAFKKWFK